MSSLKRITLILRKQRLILAGAGVSMLAYASATALYAYLSGPALQMVFTGEPFEVPGVIDVELFAPIVRYLSTNPNLTLPFILIAVALIKGLGQAGQFFLVGKVSQIVQLELREELFRRLLQHSPSFFHQRRTGDLLSRLQSDTPLVEQMIFYGLGPLIREPLTLIALLAYIFSSDPKLAAIVFITGPLAAFPLIRFTRWLKGVSKRGQEAMSEIQAAAHESFSGITVVKAYQGETREIQTFNKHAHSYFKEMQVSYFIRAIRTPVMELLGAIALGALIVVLLNHIETSDVDAAHYLSFFAAFLFMYDPLKKLGKVGDYIASGESAADRIFELIDAPLDVIDCDVPEPFPTKITQGVTFENVSFGYEDKTVIRKLNLKVQGGKSLALVGPSGAGKSTLAHLLCRFMDPDSGSIQIENTSLAKFKLTELRSNISIVSQDTFLFHGTVSANITYGLSDVSESDIHRVAKAANADDFIQALPNGYNTLLGERGVNLSGGQRQRIAIARALLRNSPILVLDEATSALDVENEASIQEALTELMKSRTVLMIAHRLTTVMHADCIAFLDNGSIVELGVHEDLLNLGGSYARWWTLNQQESERHS